MTSIKSLPTRWISAWVKTTSHNYKYSPPHQSPSKHTFHDWYFSYLNIIETWWQYNWIGYETYKRQVLFNFFLTTSWYLHWLLIRYELWIIIVGTIIITLLLLSRAVKVNRQIYKRRWHVIESKKENVSVVVTQVILEWATMYVESVWWISNNKCLYCRLQFLLV